MLDLTDKLDNEWRELIPVVNKLQKKEAEKHEPDDYDRLVKEMIFAPRGEPTQKLKNEEDIAMIEKERLEKLERERLERMRGDEDGEGSAQVKHRSADDLDDGYFMEPVVEEEEGDGKVLSYAINPSDDVEDEENVEIEDGDEPEEDEAESDEESEESSADSLEDLKADESDVEEPEMDSKVLKISNDDETEIVPEIPKQPIAIQEPTLSKKDSDALDKIPFTIKMPDSFEALVALLESHSTKVQAVVIERIIKTNHPRLLHVNKARMLKLFAYLLQYINDLFSGTTEKSVKKQFKLLHALLPPMFDLIQMNPEEGSKCFLEVVKEKYEDYKKNLKRFPQLDTTIFFKVSFANFAADFANFNFLFFFHSSRFSARSSQHPTSDTRW